MESKGADVLQGHYDYKTATFQSLSQEDQYRPIVTDATAAYLTATNQRKYQNITLIGKSLGTLALGHLLTTQLEVKDAVFVWLTPLFNNEVFRQQIMAKKHHGLFVIGSSYPHHDRAKLA
jgi:hypothetical protein